MEGNLSDRTVARSGQNRNGSVRNLFKVVPEERSEKFPGDGKVNATDSVVLKRYLAGWNVACDFVAADVNSDGKVNATDSTLLARHLAGWTVNYPIGE